ncbi:uncharacterized protein [Drosophila tropicalis]|uniref:uncharacterized protein n=1 Tax=Drosophila tropicalis TaxID=46794 RepID=UPI0035AB9BDE
MIKVNQNIRIYIVLVAMLNIFNSYIFAKCVTDHTTSAILNSFLLKCHTNKNTNKFCESQLMINIHISPSFSMNNLEKYLIVDEAYEPIKQTIVKLMSPYLVVISRDEPIIMYPLQYEKTISVDDNVQCTANVNLTKCPSEISSSDSIRSQSEHPFEKKDRKQRQTVPRSKFSRKGRNGMERKRSETVNENNKNLNDDLRFSKELSENVLSKMGLIRILDSPPNELRDLYPQVDGPEEVKNMEKGIENPYEPREHLYQKDDVGSLEVAEVNIDSDQIKDLKFKSKSDCYNTDPLYDNGKPVDNFKWPSSNGKPVNDLNYLKVFGKPVKNKKFKTSREKEWMTKYYDPSNDPLSLSTEQKWLSSGKDSFSSASKNRPNDNDFRYGESQTSKNENNFENSQTRENDAIPCDTCGGKNKKPGGKTLPNRSTVDIQEIHEGNNVNPCNCCDDNVKNYNEKSGPHSCICLTNSEYCNCESLKATRALTRSCKTNLSYSIYNMSVPLPFLATNVRIFRKRHKTWWRITPSITLNSLSGIFANGNLSILLSSHVDILQLDKSLYLQNHKLVVPKQGPSVKNCNLNELGFTLDNAFLFDCAESDINEYVIKDTLQKRKKKATANKMGVKSIADFGYFPTSLNPLQKCPNNDQRLCLNVLDDKVPAFSIKIKMPFRENAVIMKNIYKAKISRIVTDTTTKDALQILVDVINKGLEAKEFLICLSNCPLSESSSSKTKVTKMLLPHIGKTITFLLPFTKRSKRNSKFKCDVIVQAKDSGKSIVAKRSMDIQTQGRCFCVWRCQCHCIDKLESHINFNVCNRLGYSNERAAGLLLNCPPGNEKYDECLMDDNQNENKECDLYCRIITITIILLIILLLLGLLKAILGLCFDLINRCGYETVQPGRMYPCDSSARKFLVNILFFVIFPFLFWCKCFKPREEDLMIASTEWYCNPECSSDSESKKRRSTLKSRMSAGSELIYDIPDDLFKVIDPRQETRLNKDDTEDDEETTDYILKVLAESKKSLTKMLIESQNESISHSPASEKSSDAKDDKDSSEAKKFLELLTNAQIVYRMMDSPKGGLQQIPQGYRYCIQGFFLRSLGDTYEFVNYQPFTQYFIVSEENNQLEQLASPIHSYTNDYSRVYANRMDVFEAGDLSMIQPAGVPCLNIAQGNVESSLCQLAIKVDEHENLEEAQHEDQSNQ